MFVVPATRQARPSLLPVSLYQSFTGSGASLEIFFPRPLPPHAHRPPPPFTGHDLHHSLRGVAGPINLPLPVVCLQ